MDSPDDSISLDKLPISVYNVFGMQIPVINCRPLNNWNSYIIPEVVDIARALLPRMDSTSREFWKSLMDGVLIGDMGLSYRLKQYSCGADRSAWFIVLEERRISAFEKLYPIATEIFSPTNDEIQFFLGFMKFRGITLPYAQFTVLSDDYRLWSFQKMTL